MIDYLRLRRPIWADHATYGYFHERVVAFWEHDRYTEAQALREEVNRLVDQEATHQ